MTATIGSERRNELKEIVPFALITLVALTVMLYGSSCGLILTADSHSYLDAAARLRNHGELVGPAYNEYLHWPPLFPVVLRFFDSPVTQARFLNALLLLVIAFFLYKLTLSLLKHYIIAVIFFATAIFSVQLMMIGVFLWSELLFLALALTTVWLFVNERQGDSKMFIAVLVSLCLMCLQRYAGIFFAVGFAMPTFFDKQFPRRHRLIRSSALVFLPLFCLGIWWWVLMQYSSDAGLFNRVSVGSSGNAAMIVYGLARSFFPNPAWMGICLFLALSIAVVFALRSEMSAALKKLVFIVLVYLGLFLLLGTLSSDEIDRFLSVIMPLVALLVFCAIDKFYGRAGTRSRLLIVFCVLVWMVYPMLRTIRNVQAWHIRSCVETPVMK